MSEVVKRPNFSAEVKPTGLINNKGIPKRYIHFTISVDMPIENFVRQMDMDSLQRLADAVFDEIERKLKEAK